MLPQPIKVCFPFVGDGIGGSHMSALKLITNLDRDIVEPTIALHQSTGSLAQLIQHMKLDFVSLPDLELLAPAGHQKSNISSYLFKTLPFLRKFLKSRSIQIVHTNDGRIHASWALAARLAGSKVLWHHRADPTAKGVNYLAPVLANHIVSVSRFSQPRRPVLPVTQKLTVIRSPFDHPQSPMSKVAARAAIQRELGLAKGTRLLGYFGGLIDRKRPVLFVEIIHEFLRKHPDIPIAGLLYGSNAPDGIDFAEKVQSRAKELGIADRIFTMGFRQPIEQHIRGMDIMLVPAVNEPFGRTLIEAMLLGTPVVATNHGGNPEAIEDGINGFLVEAENPHSFVQPIHKLLTDDATLARISETALEQSQKQYGTDHHVTQITDIYRKIA